MASWAATSSSGSAIPEVQVGSDTLYIRGASVGYDDGTVNDMLQRFVRRLLVSELTTGVPQEHPHAFQLQPNPVGSSVNLALEQVPQNTTPGLRDAMDHVVLRQRITGHYPTPDLQGLASVVCTLWNSGQRMAPQRIDLERMSSREGPAG